MSTLYNIEEEIIQMYNEAAAALQTTLNEIDKWLDFYDHSVEGEEDLAKYEEAMAEYTRHMVQLEKKALGQSQQFCRMAGNALCHNLDVNLELLTKAMAYRNL